jgi:hypothetical protein
VDGIEVDHDDNFLTFVGSTIVKRYGNAIKGDFVGLCCAASRHVKIVAVILGAQFQNS